MKTTRSYLTDNSIDYLPLASYDDYPITNVSWHGANAYCEWVGGRLPTEAEWELAATGGDGRFYPWGDELQIDGEDMIPAIFAGTFNNLQPVDSLPEGASPFGLHHMAGNVWEWVADGYDPIYYDRSPSGNPTGAEVGLTGRIRFCVGAATTALPRTSAPVTAPASAPPNFGKCLALASAVPLRRNFLPQILGISGIF